MKNRIFVSKLLILNYIRFFFRLALFSVASVLYVISKIQHSESLFCKIEDIKAVPFFLWLICAIHIIKRFFPHSTEDIGCQKHFKRNYSKGKKEPEKESRYKTFIAATAWIIPNSVFAILYFTGIFDKGILIILTLAYSVCDMICILFFCPFREWILKNKCCTTCRIYNWDRLMLVTPLIFIPHFYSSSLVILAITEVIVWEISYKKHPERFSECSNDHLSCKSCKTKLCSNRKAFRGR
ncbi:MAG: hypothetical protein E7591_08675 [Ruminococcaceae bacterium]|nr:hypothetical protein [Oscillospiraceae bacterium]